MLRDLKKSKIPYMNFELVFFWGGFKDGFLGFLKRIVHRFFFDFII